MMFAGNGGISNIHALDPYSDETPFGYGERLNASFDPENLNDIDRQIYECGIEWSEVLTRDPENVQLDEDFG